GNTEEEGKKTASKIQNCTFVKQDVSVEKDWINIIKKIEQEHGRLDILVNNAGIIISKLLGETTLEEYMRIINVNQVSIFLGLSHSLELLKKGTNASVINISSVAGLRTSLGDVSYTSSKFAVRAMSEVAAREWAQFNIRVNAVCPGAIQTPMLMQSNVEEAVKIISEKIPMKRIGAPSELTNVVLFLASTESSYCTGSTFVADGGMVLTQ
ncbi:MAG: SDR family NAD(P)-dependent oxidoreductase, partial [Clostridia bacterium]|nr:SDR family NAD(P)-dependent oxidoreductase [Clostridia bacterium]